MTDPNDLAYPVVREYDEQRGEYFSPSTEGGLTKREYFAAMAMQGILSGPVELLREIGNKGEGVAENAVKVADVLIEALNAEKKP